jgi:hypothetical protein
VIKRAALKTTATGPLGDPENPPYPPFMKGGTNHCASSLRGMLVNPASRGMNRIDPEKIACSISDTQPMFGATDVSRASRDSSVPD